jgi:protocatechuate 3,4-dioxygenase beta subunit
MIDDHEGQRVSRRAIFAGISSVGLGSLLAACGSDEPTAVTTSTGATVTPQATTSADLTSLFEGANTCTLTPGVTQGPYYFDADKIRSDIREDKQGKQLLVAIKVMDSEECKPLANAVVEIWHCDAAGLYSGAEAASQAGGGVPGGAPPSGGPGRPGGVRPSGRPGGPGGTPPSGGPGGPGGGANQAAADLTPTDDKRYLRGAQVTNADGIVQFTTIWPGWYTGRTVHIHAMVHVNNERVLTSQMMFDEKLNDAVFATAPYSTHTGRDTTNANDFIFLDSMLMKVTEDANGYVGAIIMSADSDQDGK